MTCEVIVDVQPKKIAIALTEDKRLVEYQEEEQQASFNVGNIYYARVRKLMPGLNACFVNVGHERDAFLHYLDLGPNFNSFALEMGKRFRLSLPTCLRYLAKELKLGPRSR